MHARRLIEGATYGPDDLKVLSEAFDAAWARVERQFGADPAQQEAARLRLAHAVLAVAPQDGLSAESVCEAALKVMALSYPGRFGGRGAEPG